MPQCFPVYAIFLIIQNWIIHRVDCDRGTRSIFENFIKVTQVTLTVIKRITMDLINCITFTYQLLIFKMEGRKINNCWNYSYSFEDLIFFPKLAVAKLNYLWNDRIE